MALDAAIRAIITICVLVFSAKVLGELFAKVKIPAVLGELTAGILTRTLRIRCNHHGERFTSN